MMQHPNPRADIEHRLGLHLAVANHAKEPPGCARGSTPPVSRQVVFGAGRPEVAIGGFAVTRHVEARRVA
jgi:hypothetical protein